MFKISSGILHGPGGDKTTKEDMKKYSIFLMSALAIGLTACDDKSDLGIAQVNPQEPIVEADGLTLAGSAAYTSTINLDNTVGQRIEIASVADASGLPENAVVSLELAVAKDENMTDAQILPLTGGAVQSDDLEDVIVSLYNITPEEVKPWTGIIAYATIGTEKSRLGGDGFFYLKQQTSIIPVDAHLEIENSYFIGGTLSQKMDHSDLHAYVDNNFISIFEVTDAQAASGFEWQIIPGSQESAPDASQCWGPAPSGNNLRLGAKGTITAPGRYRLVADMLAKTYTLTFAYEVLYTPGTGNGWNQEASMYLYTDNYSKYFGVTSTGAEGDAEGKFKLCATTNWDINWGLDNGRLTPGGADIATVPAGLWWVVADLNSLTLSLLHVENIGMIGLNGDWNTDIAMTPSSDRLQWTGTITADSDTEFKFRFNGGWDANLGGDKDRLVMDGGNLPVSAGTYDVVLDLSAVPYTCTLTAK